MWPIKYTETPSGPTTFAWSQACKYVKLQDQFVSLTDINDNTLYKMPDVVLEWVWLLQALTSTKREPKFFCSPLCLSRVSKRITDSSLCLISNSTSLEFKHKRVSLFAVVLIKKFPFWLVFGSILHFYFIFLWGFFEFVEVLCLAAVVNKWPQIQRFTSSKRSPRTTKLRIAGLLFLARSTLHLSWFIFHICSLV